MSNDLQRFFKFFYSHFDTNFVETANEKSHPLKDVGISPLPVKDVVVEMTNRKRFLQSYINYKTQDLQVLPCQLDAFLPYLVYKLFH